MKEAGFALGYRQPTAFFEIFRGILGTMPHARIHGLSFISSENLFEIKISEVHVPVRSYVHGKNILSLAQVNLEELRDQIPVVPLTPSQRIRRIIGRRDL